MMCKLHMRVCLSHIAPDMHVGGSYFNSIILFRLTAPADWPQTNAPVNEFSHYSINQIAHMLLCVVMKCFSLLKYLQTQTTDTVCHHRIIFRDNWPGLRSPSGKRYNIIKPSDAGLQWWPILILMIGRVCSNTHALLQVTRTKALNARPIEKAVESIYTFYIRFNCCNNATLLYHNNMWQWMGLYTFAIFALNEIQSYDYLRFSDNSMRE